MFSLPGILSQRADLKSSLVFCDNSNPSPFISAIISDFRLKYSANYNSVNWCDNTAPSSFINSLISLFLLTYSAEYNSVDWCSNSAPSAFIAKLDSVIPTSFNICENDAPTELYLKVVSAS